MTRIEKVKVYNTIRDTFLIAEFDGELFMLECMCGFINTIFNNDPAASYFDDYDISFNNLILSINKDGKPAILTCHKCKKRFRIINSLLTMIDTKKIDSNPLNYTVGVGQKSLDNLKKKGEEKKVENTNGVSFTFLERGN